MFCDLTVFPLESYCIVFPGHDSSVNILLTHPSVCKGPTLAHSWWKRLPRTSIRSLACCQGTSPCAWDDVTLLVLVRARCNQVVLFNIHHGAEHYIIVILSVSAGTRALFRHAEC